MDSFVNRIKKIKKEAVVACDAKGIAEITNATKAGGADSSLSREIVEAKSTILPTHSCTDLDSARRQPLRKCSQQYIDSTEQDARK